MDFDLYDGSILSMTPMLPRAERKPFNSFIPMLTERPFATLPEMFPHCLPFSDISDFERGLNNVFNVSKRNAPFHHTYRCPQH